MDFFQTTKQSSTVFIHRLEEAETGVWNFSLRPSEISYSFCPRLYSLLKMGLVRGVKNFSARNRRVMENGHYVHQRFHAYTHKLDCVYKHSEYGDPNNEHRCEERLIEHPSGLRGTYDAILDLDDDYLYVTDFKSIKPSTSPFDNGFDNLTKPLDYHVKQLVIYMGMISDTYTLPKPIRGLYVYECKATQNLKEYVVPWDESTKNLYFQLLGYISLMNKAAEEGNPDLAPCLCRKDPCKNWDLERIRNDASLGKHKRVRM